MRPLYQNSHRWEFIKSLYWDHIGDYIGFHGVLHLGANIMSPAQREALLESWSFCRETLKAQGAPPGISSCEDWILPTPQSSVHATLQPVLNPCCVEAPNHSRKKDEPWEKGP